MDDKMMTALLASYKAPMTAQNANVARQFFASNPDVAERRAMGMRGSGLDDNSDLLDAQLDKHIADTTIPDGVVTVGQPVKADSVPPPSKLGAGPNDAAPVNRPAAPKSAGAPDKKSTQYGEGAELPPGLPQGVAPLDTGVDTGNHTADVPPENGSGTDILKLILGALGVAGTATSKGGS